MLTSFTHSNIFLLCLQKRTTCSEPMMKTPLSGHFMIWMKNTQLMGHKHLWTAFFRYTVTYYWPISTPLPTIGELVLLVSEQWYISYTSNPPLILTYKQVALMWKGSLQVSFMTHGLHTSGLRYVMTLYVCCVNQQLWISSNFLISFLLAENAWQLQFCNSIDFTLF